MTHHDRSVPSRRPRAGALAASLLLAGLAGAQEAPDLIGPGGALRFNVPIHDEPGYDGAAAEVWASRSAYKVSFHDGISFYPVLGTAYDHDLPVTWRTTSIRAGDRELSAGGREPSRQSTAWRYELHRGPVVEAYDVRPDGLEQTFVLAHRPDTAGDLVIRGTLSTELSTDRERGRRHDAIVFRDAADQPIVSYGAATVVDAAGDTLPVASSCDGDEIHLHVDGDWLARARYPVVIDPLLASVVVLNTTQSSRDPAIAHSASSSLLITDARAVSASDFDTMGVTTGAGFSSPALIFSVVSSTVSTPHTRAAYVRQPNRWCIAMELRRQILTVRINAIGWHLRAPGDNAFRTVTNQVITGTNDTDPVVGGDAGGILPGDNALIAFKRGSGSGSAIYGAVIDCANDALVQTRQLSDSAATRCEFPDVIEQIEMKIDPWAVVWQEEGSAGRRQLRMTWVFNDGDPTRIYGLGHQTDLTRHDFRPKIDGNRNAYAVAFISQTVGGTVPADPVGPEIWVDSIRLDYIAGTSVGKRHLPLTRLRSGLNLATRDVAFDSETRSHWGVAVESRFLTGTYTFDRIGFDSAAAESLTVGSGTGGVATTYVARSHTFPIVYSSGTVLHGRQATYAAVPPPVLYGQSCGFGTLDSDTSHGNLPFAGHERFELRMQPASQQIDGALLLGVRAVDLPLPLGCNLYVEPAATIPFSTSATPSFELHLALPSTAAGRLFAQIVYLTRSSGTFGATNGYRFDVVR